MNLSAGGSTSWRMLTTHLREQDRATAALAFRYTSAVPMKTTRISRREFLGAASAAATLTLLPVPVRSAVAPTESGDAISHFSTILISTSAAPIVFNPDQALGSSMDILSHAVVEK